ncbi:uncharacterized protein VP01_4294g1 [Puccinia sorghi]|uniref:Uncharacterized protein n=1 Tax=Puccinia sorghi TaxID=27349 RepID=A0A0L6US49_9BASI|nr:uncharacterized protein VP01_4294g1 [Puccinia sorghi]
MIPQVRIYVSLHDSSFLMSVFLINKTMEPVSLDNHSRGYLNKYSKFLGIYVLVTNDDPCYIGYYYLQLHTTTPKLPTKSHLITKSTHNKKIEFLAD